MQAAHFLFGINIANLDSFRLTQKFDVGLVVRLERVTIQMAFFMQQLASLLFNLLKQIPVLFVFLCLFRFIQSLHVFAGLKELIRVQMLTSSGKEHLTSSLGILDCQNLFF